MRKLIFTTLIVLALSGMVSGYETSVSWIEGTNPPDFSRTPDDPTTNDLIYFTIPTDVYNNFLAAEQTLGGVPALSVDLATRTIELYIQPPAPGGSMPYNPVCGLEGYFGQLEAGSWLFYVHFSGTIYLDNFDVTSAPATPVVSGNIMSNNGRPIGDVIVTFSSGGGVATTNSNGDYSRNVPYNWSGTAIPSKTGYTFNPTFRSYVNVTSNRTNQDYVGFVAPVTPIISGNIMSDDGRPLSGVTITFSAGGGSTTTNANGDYAKNVPNNWSGMAVPGKTGYTFDPSFRSYVNVTSNRTNQNYTGFGQSQINQYFTEQFSSGSDTFDLSYKSVNFEPTTDDNFYTATIQDITQLPTNPSGGTDLELGDDDFEFVQLNQATVSLYGSNFTGFYVGSNGYITFDRGDQDYTDTLAAHFELMRISGLFTDLNPSSVGQVSVKQLADRVAVTYDHIIEYNTGNLNTFQIEMFFNGRLRISWLDCATQYCIVGLSAGTGLPSDFEETDFSDLSSIPPPPPPPVTDYFTEQFSPSTGPFDLSNKSIIFTPTTDDTSYTATLHDITQLPMNPSGGTDLGLTDDSYVFVRLDQAMVTFYGSSFPGFYVGSNGYITFTEGDTDYSASLADHFMLMRISSMFTDLNPSAAGRLTAKQIPGSVAVTWENIPEYNTNNLNTFQIVMYFDGRIQISWLTCATQYCIVGLSAGGGIPADFEQTDLSDLGVTPPPPVTTYLTEQFTSGTDAFDLSYTSVTFTPTSDGLNYGASLQEISSFPTDPAGGKSLALGDDDSIAVNLSGSATVSIYGNSYSTFYVGSNGYITFTEPDIAYSATLSNHFDTKRISALFTDLNPSAAGLVSWKQLADRVAITWQDVPAYGSSSSNTFQVVMYFDGRLQISWLAVAVQSCIVGLSDGLGIPEDFEETDFSELGTIPPPVTGYLTEQFTSGTDAFDLTFTSITFTPTSDGLNYGASLEKISVLPTDPVGGKGLTLGDDSSVPVTLSSSAMVSIYGSSYSTFYVGSNGYITFTEPDTAYSDTLSNHFDTKRISALFTDLNPSASGQVSWKQLSDRVAVTWQNVPAYGSSSPNTFQVVMYFDGRLQISWLGIAVQKCIVGLSDGLGVPEDFEETDLSDLGSETTPPITGYLTEQFTSGTDAFDLSFTSVTFTPASDGASYSVVAQEISQFPTSPSGGKSLTLGDDSSVQVTLSGSAEVSIFGDSFSSFYVGSNGYITFTESDRDYSESLADHFDTLRISGLFVDLNPSASGQVSWKQLGDRVAVTWQNIPQYGVNNSNTFQIVMYFDGRIQISWLAVAAQRGIVGLSDGLGVPEDFVEMDFSSLL
jgi:hypothetical protein